MIGVDKAFRVLCSIQKPDGTEVQLDKRYVQADQGSDMNVISAGLVRHLHLDLHSLAEVGFKGLSMRTADHRDTVLHHWVWLRVIVEGIIREIRCFMAPEVTSITSTGETEYLSLILGLPWLYSVDALISIRQSTIMVDDASIGETVRGAVDPELVFYKDHNLLMYPKSVMTVPEKAEDVESSNSESSDSEDDLSNVEDPRQSF